MRHIGDFRVDDYVSLGAQLHRFSSGAVYAPTGNATYTIYENNSVNGPGGGAAAAQNLAQLNSKTGLYTARIQLTAAAGYEAGKDYIVHYEATVDGVAAADVEWFRVIAADLSAADVRTELDANSTVLAALVGYVDELETRLTAARAAKLDSLPSVIKKNTALAAFPFKMVTALGAPATGLTVTAERNLDGAGFAACANSVVEVSGGWYKIDLAASDLNANTVALKFTATGAKQTDIGLVTNS